MQVKRVKMKYIKIKWLATKPHGKQERFFDIISEKDYLENELYNLFGDFDEFDLEKTELLIECLVDCGVLRHLRKVLSEKQRQYLTFSLKIHDVIYFVDPVPAYKALEVLHIEKQEKPKKEQQ